MGAFKGFYGVYRAFKGLWGLMVAFKGLGVLEF